MIIDGILNIGGVTFEHLDLALPSIKQNSLPLVGFLLQLLKIFYNLLLLTKLVYLQKQEKVYIDHSTDCYGKNFGYMNWLKLLCKALIQVLLNYLIGLGKD